MPRAKARVQAVRQYRLKSKAALTRKLAQIPTQFHVTNIPQSNFLVIPEVSSSKREYIPIAFMSPKDGLCSNKLKLFPKASLYHFSVLSSSAHMAWVNKVSGRLKMDFNYSTELVYNTFPWPEALTPELKKKLEASGKKILAARAKKPDATLAQLYNPEKMSATLRKAHKDNDLLVLQAYGFEPDWNQEQIFAALYERYQQLIATKQA